MTSDVVAWLRSAEGEQWSRSRALDRAGGGPLVYMPTLWRAAGVRDLSCDPCGRPQPPARRVRQTEGPPASIESPCKNRNERRGTRE